MWKSVIYFTLQNSQDYGDFCVKLGYNVVFDEPLWLGGWSFRCMDEVREMVEEWKDKWEDAKIKVRLGDVEALCCPPGLNRFSVNNKSYIEEGLSASTCLTYKLDIAGMDKVYVVVHRDEDSLAAVRAIYEMYAKEHGYPSKYSWNVTEGVMNISYDVNITFEEE